MNGLLIGRFQPFHLGHMDAIGFALSRVDELWLGIGSSNKPPGKNNPFSADERRGMIEASLSPQTAKKTRIYHIPDVNDHEKWVENINSIVPTYDVVFSNDEMTRNAYSKHGIDVLPIPLSRRGDLSGTNVRDKIVRDQRWDHLVPAGTKNILEKIGARDLLRRL